MEFPWNGGILEKMFEIVKRENMRVDSMEEKKKIVKLSFECEKTWRERALFFLVTSVCLHVWKTTKKKGILSKEQFQAWY